MSKPNADTVLENLIVENIDPFEAYGEQLISSGDRNMARIGEIVRLMARGASVAFYD